MRMYKDGSYMEVEGEIAIDAFLKSGWVTGTVARSPEKEETEIAEEPKAEESEPVVKAKRSKKKN